MAVPSNILAMTNGTSFNLSGTISSGVLTLTPPTYTGWPTSGWTPLVCETEIIYVTDLSIHPWPITRGEESTTPASHGSGSLVENRLTAAALGAMISNVDKILTDDAGNVLSDSSGNVLYAL